jgi:hypothetical protein
MPLSFCDLKVVFCRKQLFGLFDLQQRPKLVLQRLFGLQLEYPCSIKHQEEKIYLRPLVLLREV